MKTEIQPQDSNRAEAFRLWMSSPMPMVTLVKTMDVHRLVKVSRKSGVKFTTQYTDQFCNPMVMWGKYRKGLFKSTLPVSFQFHHVQMDGGHAARFLQRLQYEIYKVLK